MRRKLTAGLLLGLGAGAFVLVLGWTGLLDVQELKTYDWRVARAVNPASIDRDIVLVEINDESIRAVAAAGGGRWPWPRAVLGSAIDFISRSEPRAIAVDLTITEPDITKSYGDNNGSGAESDAALAESVARARRVIMLADAVHPGVVGGANTAKAEWTTAPYRLGPAIEERPLLIPPLPEISKAAIALGHNWINQDTDGPVRRMPPFIRIGDRYVPLLGVAAALVAGGFKPEEVVLEGRTIRVRDRVIPLIAERVPDRGAPSKSHDQLTMLINYKAPVLVNGERPYRSYEIRDLLASEAEINAGEKPELSPDVFKDKIVFIGLTASGLIDVFNTPFGRGVMPGIQLHASIADSILTNAFIRQAPDSARVWSTIGFALLVALMATVLPYIGAAAGALLVVSGWIWYSLYAFKHGLWLNMSQPLLGCAIALFAGTAYQYFVEGAEKRVVKRLFGRYVSKDVYQQLISNPELAELGGRRRDMTVLFSDIRGFTTVTEKGDPEALVAQLNEYFSRMVEVVFRHHGTVDKFVGDMVMALFGAPVDDTDHAEHAVTAAIDMCTELRELNRKWASEGRAQLDIGIGINSGGMIAGNIGSSSIMSYTVIGDNVNLGSRLESLNKEYATRIIISDATRSRLHGQYDIRPLGDVVVKGKTRAVAIFEVIVTSPLQAAPEEAKL